MARLSRATGFQFWNTAANTRDSLQRLGAICRLITVRNALRGEGHCALFRGPFWRAAVQPFMQTFMQTFMRYTIWIEGSRPVSALRQRADKRAAHDVWA